MRQRAEHELSAAQINLVPPDKRDIASGYAGGRTALLIRGREGQRKHRMTKDECAELASSIAAGAEHADWYLIHT